MELENFFFPVSEREIAQCEGYDRPGKPINAYKAIVRTDRDEVISVVRDTYKLIPNRELIEPFFEQLEKLRIRWTIDESHSFCDSNRMRLQITFPELQLQDKESRIPLSLYLHNSYDMSEGVRLLWGAIRLVCSNGMVLGQTLGRIYARHTQGFDYDRVSMEFDHASEKLNTLQSRIQYLQSVPTDERFISELRHALGKRRLQAIVESDKTVSSSRWDLFNDVTHFISHEEPKQRRADLQTKVSKVYQL